GAPYPRGPGSPRAKPRGSGFRRPTGTAPITGAAATRRKPADAVPVRSPRSALHVHREPAEDPRDRRPLRGEAATVRRSEPRTKRTAANLPAWRPPIRYFLSTTPG